MSSHYMQIAEDAARAAAEVLRPAIKRPRQITSKGFRDIVTDADFAADDAIQQVIKGACPDDYILSEESEAAKDLKTWQPPEGFWWCIDPIDGTSNFARGIPSWSISIAVFKGTQPYAAAVYDVTRDDLFSGMVGAGAFRNGEPIKATTGIAFEWAMCSVDYPTATQDRQNIITVANTLLPQVRTIRTWGTSALALAHVAAGYLDAYINLTRKPWDIGAGILLAQVSGASVTALDGSPWTLDSQTLLVCNPDLHPTFVDVLGGIVDQA